MADADGHEKGGVVGVLTYYLTRLARNSYDGGRLIYMTGEGTIRRIATPENAYVDSADDKFMMQIHFAMAKKSSDDTSQFVRCDVESKLLRGEYPGKLPPGYLNITRAGHIASAGGDVEKERLLRSLGRPQRREEIEPIDGPLVRRLFEEASTGVHTLAWLRKFSHGIGLRARKLGKVLSKNAIRKLLGNPYYYGAIAYNGAVYDDTLLRERTGNPEASVQHEPLVSRDLFERVQKAVFGRRRRGCYRRHRFPSAAASCAAASAAARSPPSGRRNMSTTTARAAAGPVLKLAAVARVMRNLEHQLDRYTQVS